MLTDLEVEIVVLNRAEHPVVIFTDRPFFSFSPKFLVFFFQPIAIKPVFINLSIYFLLNISLNGWNPELPAAKSLKYGPNISKNESLDKFCLEQNRFAQNKLRELQGLPVDVWAFLSENQFNLNISSYILKS